MVKISNRKPLNIRACGMIRESKFKLDSYVTVEVEKMLISKLSNFDDNYKVSFFYNLLLCCIRISSKLDLEHDRTIMYKYYCTKACYMKLKKRILGNYGIKI